MKKATFGSGCFWCVEAIFKRVKGVSEVVSGYSGGNIINPCYKEVCNGVTGHAEAVQLMYNPDEISYEELLEIFWKSHDPTQLNRQGADVGTQYRSVIFYHDEEQKIIAETLKQKLTTAKIWDDPIVTIIEPFKNFFVAEEYHQDYYDNNRLQGYCQMIITPKIKKLETLFKEKLKA